MEPEVPGLYQVTKVENLAGCELGAASEALEVRSHKQVDHKVVDHRVEEHIGDAQALIVHTVAMGMAVATVEPLEGITEQELMLLAELRAFCQCSKGSIDDGG